MKNIRKCIGCGEKIKIEKLIKITFDKINNEILINPNSKIFGRSAYLCYNNTCIMNSIKKDKLKKSLKTDISEELKGKLIEYS